MSLSCRFLKRIMSATMNRNPTAAVNMSWKASRFATNPDCIAGVPPSPTAHPKRVGLPPACPLFFRGCAVAIAGARSGMTRLACYNSVLLEEKVRLVTLSDLKLSSLPDKKCQVPEAFQGEVDAHNLLLSNGLRHMWPSVIAVGHDTPLCQVA